MNFGCDESPPGSYTPGRFALPANPVRGDGFGCLADRLSIVLRFLPVPELRSGMGSSGGGEPNHDPAVKVKAPANVPAGAGQDGRIGGSPSRGRREATAPEAALNE